MSMMLRPGAVGRVPRRAAAVLALPVLASLAINGDKRFEEKYAKAGGSNATFVFPPEGNHSWAYRGRQSQALEPDLIAALNG